MLKNIDKLIVKTAVVSTLLVGCGKNTPDQATAAKVGLKLNGASTSSVTYDVNNFENGADSFTFFFFPKAGTMNWDSKVFNKNDDEQTKYNDIFTEIMEMSNKIDANDGRIYEYQQMNVAHEISKVELGCDSDSGSTGDDDFDWLVSSDVEAETCESLDEKIANNELVITDEGTLKRQNVMYIQTSIDDSYITGTGISATIEYVGEAVNWVDYGESSNNTVNLFDVAEDGTQTFNPNIYFPSINENKYSSEGGTIYDIKYEDSEFAVGVKFLKFKMKEKDKDGEFTGFYYDVELEESNFSKLPLYNFEGILRYSGDVFKKNETTHEVVGHGIMKFDFLPAAEDTSDDTAGDDTSDDDDDDFDW